MIINIKIVTKTKEVIGVNEISLAMMLVIMMIIRRRIDNCSIHDCTISSSSSRKFNCRNSSRLVFWKIITLQTTALKAREKLVVFKLN